MPKKEIAVFGLGRFGLNVAKTLYRLGHTVLAVDKDEGRVQGAVDHSTRALQADVTDDEAIKAMGIDRFDAAVVAIGSRLEDSVLAAMVLKEHGVKHILAKASSERHGRLLERVGADRIVFPERDMAIRTAKTIVSANVLDLIEITPDVSIEEMTAGGRLVGRTLAELDLRARYGVTIIAVRRGSRVIVSPGADEMIMADDTLVTIGSNGELARLETLIGG